MKSSTCWIWASSIVCASKTVVEIGTSTVFSSRPRADVTTMVSSCLTSSSPFVSWAMTGACAASAKTVELNNVILRVFFEQVMIILLNRLLLTKDMSSQMDITQRL